MGHVEDMQFLDRILGDLGMTGEVFVKPGGAALLAADPE
jgi:hypothetical protein